MVDSAAMVDGGAMVDCGAMVESSARVDGASRVLLNGKASQWKEVTAFFLLSREVH